MPTNRTLVLTRDAVASLLSIKDCIVAVEQAFRMYGRHLRACESILPDACVGATWNVHRSRRRGQ